MTASALTDTTNTVATAGSGLPIEVWGPALIMVLVAIAVIILGSYQLYRGPSFRELLEGRAKRRDASPDRRA